MSASHVVPQQLVRLKPTNWVEAQEVIHALEDEVEYGSEGKQMVEDIQIGDNMVVKCQTSIDEKLWILLCDKGLHMVTQAS